MIAAQFDGADPLQPALKPIGIFVVTKMGNIKAARADLNVAIKISPEDATSIERELAKLK